MSFDELTGELLPVLHEILVLRLSVNRTWNNVSLETGQRYMDICWQDPKNMDGSSQTKRVAPFNADTLCREISYQFNKLQVDIKQVSL